MTATATPPIGKVIDRLAADFKSDHGIPAGDIAALRRYRPGDGGSPVFWKLAVHYLEPDGYLPEYEGAAREKAEKRWAAILAGMAETKGRHDKKRKLGKVLRDEDVKEHRVLRLLRARDLPLLRIVRSVVHQLSSAGAAFDWNDLAQLILSDGTKREKSVRRRIARDYYRPAPAKAEETE